MTEDRHTDLIAQLVTDLKRFTDVHATGSLRIGIDEAKLIVEALSTQEREEGEGATLRGVCVRVLAVDHALDQAVIVDREGYKIVELSDVEFPDDDEALSTPPVPQEGEPVGWRCEAISNPEDCGWPFCGCDPVAQKVLASIQEHDLELVPRTAIAGQRFVLRGEIRRILTETVRGEINAATDGILALIPPAAPVQPSPDREALALADIAAERRRQIEAEGYNPEHDEGYLGGELCRAAASYAYEAGRTDHQRAVDVDHMPPLWPWSPLFWKPTTRRRDLIKAGALIVAEIERLDRAEPLLNGGQETGSARAGSDAHTVRPAPLHSDGGEG